MLQRIDLTGKIINGILVIREAKKQGQKRYWRCKCHCGKIKNISQNALRKPTKSCGCLQTAHCYKHGMHKTPENNAWRKMKNRCNNPNNHKFERYGKRGIKVCDRWLHSFENFYSDMGKRPSKKHSLHRLNNDGNYEPSNCVWATAKIQMNNTSQNIKITFHGETLSLSQWSRKLRINRGALFARLRRGWSAEKTLGTPIDKKYRSSGNLMNTKLVPR